MNYTSLSLRPGIETLSLLGALLLLLVISIAGIKFLSIRRQVRKEIIILELTPPPSPHNTQRATEEFFTVIGHVINTRSWHDRVNGRKATIALEVVSTRRQGIRYLVRLPRHDQQIFLRNLAAFAPTVTAEEVGDYLKPYRGTRVNRLFDLRQSGPRSYALRHSREENANDPIAYVTNAFAQLERNELIALQLVLSPSGDWHLSPRSRPMNASAVPADIVDATMHKNHQAQFQTSVRILIQTTDRERSLQRAKGIRSALTGYSYEGYQSLLPRLNLPGWFRRYQLYAFRHRLPKLFSRYSCLLASSELAALYHFPYGTTSQTEDIVVGRSTALPVPLAVKNQPDLDVVLGENDYRGHTTPIGLTALERERHMYIVGGTGNGKSTLLQYAIVQDMQAGKGVAVIDPHGDLAESLLGYVPKTRIDDVIYFNPSDIGHPIGLNLLELTPGLTDDDLLLEKDMVTESIVSMFRKIFSTNNTNGHRIEYVLRNAVQTALTLPHPTLFTVYNLLNDAVYRGRVLSKLRNPDLKLFWREFAKAGSYQQVSMAAGITAKIGRFLFSASARRILEQPTSSFDFDELMSQGKILICNVSKGQLGEDTAELFGIMVLAKLQLATLRRANRKKADRKPFYVYVDEFQNFATPSFVQLLSEARKYGLFLTMAEQSTAQQSERRLIDIVLANVGTIISFRTSSQQDEQILQPLLSPYVEPGTLSRLPAYTFYLRLAALQPQPPFSGRTILMAEPPDELIVQHVILASRMAYGRRPTDLPVIKQTKSPKKAMKLVSIGEVGSSN